MNLMFHKLHNETVFNILLQQLFHFDQEVLKLQLYYFKIQQEVFAKQNYGYIYFKVW